MYASYFGLNENPFSITPDPRYLFLSARYREALAHLLYGVTESGGFIQLTGEVGTGKTTLVRSLLEQLPEQVDAAVILNPRIWRKELLVSICRELHVDIDASESPQAIIDTLNRHLLDAHARGRRTIVIIDEAQALSADVLEQVRLLSNLETSQQKLLQIILIGQPELRELLEGDNLRQLAQRITGRYHLQPLTLIETRTYIAHRLEVAGATGTMFTPSAIRKIHRLARGIPRLINVISDRALLGAYAQGQRQVTYRLAARAGREVLGPSSRSYIYRFKTWGFALLLVGVTSFTALSASGIIGWPGSHADRAAGPQPDSAAVAAVASSTSRPKAAHQATLSDWLAEVAPVTGTDSAFAALFKLWSKNYPAESSVSGCRQAEKVGLRCIYHKGVWNDLRKWNRPAIITLTNSHGTQFQVVVSAFKGGEVTLDAGGKKQRFSIGAVERYWYGAYLILWRPPAGMGHILRAGMRGAPVHWLSVKLSKLQGRGKAPSNTYDKTLESQVKRFQRAHDLAVDGIAGKRTLIRLNTALQVPNTPYLYRSKNGPAAPSLAQATAGENN